MTTYWLAVHALGWSVLLSLWQGAMICALFALWLRFGGGRSPSCRQRAALCCEALLVLLLVVNAIVLFELWRPLGASALPRSLPRLNGEASAAALTSALVSSRPGLVTTLGRVDGVARWSSALWLAGFAFSVGLLVMGRRAARVVLSGARARPDLRQRVGRLATRLGVRGPVETMQGALWTPGVLGWVKPVLVLPEYADDLLSEDQLDAVLAHELAHVRRRDHALQLIESLMGCVLFFHPAANYFARASRRAREEACDDLAVAVCGSALVYARALERLESARSCSPPRMIAAVALDDGELLGRVRRLLRPEREQSRRFDGFYVRMGTVGAAALLLACVVPAAVVPAVPLARMQNQLMRIAAEDPAGRFTVTMLPGHVLGATIGGVQVAPSRLSQEGNRLRFLNADGSVAFMLRLRQDGFEWSPRRARGSPG